MDDATLAAVRERAAAQVFATGPTAPLLPVETIDAIVVAIRDRRLLLAEVDRLRAEHADDGEPDPTVLLEVPR